MPAFRDNTGYSCTSSPTTTAHPHIPPLRWLFAGRNGLYRFGDAKMPDQHKEPALLVTDSMGSTEWERYGKTLPHQETQTNFETADLSHHVDIVHVEDRQQIADRLFQRGPTEIERPEIQLGPGNSLVLVLEENRTVPAFVSGDGGWQPRLRGVPSWLTSLIVHLSVILVLALVSISDGGRTVIAMLASADERVDIEPYTTFDMALDPVEIETLSEEMEVPSSQLMQPTDLAPVLENALLDASLSSESQDSFSESLATEGVPNSDLPRQENGGGAKFFGVGGNGRDFVFIVDCSGSMADYGRWHQAVRELKQSVNDLKEDQRFLILLYNDGFIAMNNDAKLVKSDSRSRKKAFKWLVNNRPDSWTFCAEALGKALSLKPDAVFLLSDGEFNDRQDVFFVLDTMNSKERLSPYEEQQIPVHTIALGSHFGRHTMKRIADENSGEFRLVD